MITLHHVDEIDSECPAGCSIVETHSNRLEVYKPLTPPYSQHPIPLAIAVFFFFSLNPPFRTPRSGS